MKRVLVIICAMVHVFALSAAHKNPVFGMRNARLAERSIMRIGPLKAMRV